MNTLAQAALGLRSDFSGPATRNRLVVVLAAAAFAVGTVLLFRTQSWRFGLLFLIGGALGMVLYHAAFGFTSAWRIFISDRRGAGLRSQMLMLGVASALFFPVLAAGSLFGTPVGGVVAPIGVSLFAGSFLFGIGMQLGGGCASGTLYTAGSANTRMWITLTAFIAGSVIATAHIPW